MSIKKVNCILKLLFIYHVLKFYISEFLAKGKFKREEHTKDSFVFPEGCWILKNNKHFKTET